MTQNEESLSDIDANINTISELPPRPIKIFNSLVEFPMFIIMLAFMLSGAAVSNIVLYRTCVHALNHSRGECYIFLSLEKNNGSQKLEKEVQQYATFVTTVKSLIESVAPAILSLFVGVWSDRHGRKPLIVWPILGMTLSGIMMVVYSMMDNLGPWWYILPLVPYSLTGGFTVLFTGAYCYVSDVTSSEHRSLRMTLMEASVSVGVVVGGFLSSYVLKAVGHVYLLLIAATIFVIAYLYANISLRESLTGAVQGSITSVLDFQLVRDMANECFKPRLNNGRAQIILITFANSLSILILYGLMNLTYLYSREKLNWNMKDYTQYSSIDTSISFVGSFIGIAIIQRFLRVSDLAFANIAFISQGVEYVIKALAVTTWHMYFASGVSLFKGLSAPLLRSLMTKILPVQDIAKIFALMSAIEGLCPLIGPVLYNTVYECTLSNFSGAIYLLSAGIVSICIVLTGTVQYYRWNVSSLYQPIEDVDTQRT